MIGIGDKVYDPDNNYEYGIVVNVNWNIYFIRWDTTTYKDISYHSYDEVEKFLTEDEYKIFKRREKIRKIFVLK